MKKFGTPSGAGPGVDWEKVGFCGVGLPSGFVNTLGEGLWRSEGCVVVACLWLSVEPPLDAVRSEPFRIEPLGVVVVRREGEVEGEDEGDGVDPPPPLEGELGAWREGVSGVEGTGTDGAGGGWGSETLGVGGSVGVVTGPTVRLEAGPVTEVKAAVRRPARSMATATRRRTIRLRRIVLASAVVVRAAPLALSSGSLRIKILSRGSFLPQNDAAKSPEMRRFSLGSGEIPGPLVGAPVPRFSEFRQRRRQAHELLTTAGGT
jgi:hypothetical protein